MNINRKFTLIIIALITITISACDNNNDKGDKVAILKLGTHPLIDEIESAIVSKIKSEMGEEIKISVFNANFDDDLLQQSAIQIINGGYKLAIPITTPASNILINRSNGQVPIVFSFVSTPDSIWGKGNDKPAYVTGTSDQINYDKNLKLIRTLLPNAKKIGYLANEGEQQAREGLEEVRNLVSKYDFQLVLGPIGAPSEVDNAARALIGQVDAFLVGGDNTVVSGIGSLLSVASKNDIPVFAVERTSVEKGAVAAHGVDYSALGIKTAEIALRVLSGEKTKDIPIVYFTDTNLFVNKRSITELGINEIQQPYISY